MFIYIHILSYYMLFLYFKLCLIVNCSLSCSFTSISFLITGAMNNGQSRETGNTCHTRRRKTHQRRNTLCAGHHYTQTNTTNVNKTRALLQTTEGKDEPNIVQCIYNCLPLDQNVLCSYRPITISLIKCSYPPPF
jgi:hypothetical protein